MSENGTATIENPKEVERLVKEDDKSATRFWKRFPLAVLLSIVASFVIVHLVSRARDNEAKFNKIRAGMSKAEVGTILGRPTASRASRYHPGDPVRITDTYTYYGRSSWIFHDGTAYVDWSPEEKVVAAGWKNARDSDTGGLRGFIQDMMGVRPVRD